MTPDFSISANSNSGFGVLTGVGYLYKINSTWGIVSGLEVTSYKSEVSFMELNDRYMTRDNYENDFEWRLTFNNLSEKWTGTYLNIPIMVQLSPAGANRFFTKIGIIAGIPLKGKYTAKYSGLTTSGYYPETGAEYTDIEFRGFGDFEGSSSNGNLDLKVAVLASAECGLKWTLPNSNNLSLSGYIDYGLNNILKASDTQTRLVLYDKNNPTNLLYNGLSNSETTQATGTEPYVNKLVPLAFGIKVTYGLSFAGNHNE